LFVAPPEVGVEEAVPPPVVPPVVLPPPVPEVVPPVELPPPDPVIELPGLVLPVTVFEGTFCGLLVGFDLGYCDTKHK